MGTNKNFSSGENTSGDTWYVDNYVLLKEYYDMTISRIAARCIRKGNIAMEEYEQYSYILDVLDEISETGDYIVTHKNLYEYVDRKIPGGINTLKKEGKRWDVEHYLDEDALSNKPYGKDDLQDVLNNLALAQEMDLLPSEQAQLLKDVYYNETTQKQVAYSTNCSTRSIRRHQTKVLSALRSKLIS